MSLLAHDQHQRSTADVTQGWVRSIGLAAAVGLGYLVAADFSVRLLVQPEGVAVFWPAAGISSGILIGLGPRARWPVLAGVLVATVVTHLIIKDPLWAGIALGLCNAAEALVYGRSDPALLRRRVQPSSAALRPWLARGSRRRDDCIGDWGEQLPTG